MLSRDLASVLGEAKSKQIGPDLWLFRGVKGHWRTVTGRDVFYPKDGGKPMTSDGKAFKGRPKTKHRDHKPRGLSATLATAAKRTGHAIARGAGEVGRALARDAQQTGRDLSKAKHAIVHSAKEVTAGMVAPFKKAYRLATSKTERRKTWKSVKKLVSTEAHETGHMLKTFAKMARGKKVAPHARKAALSQAADIVKAALISTVAAHIAAAGPAAILATIVNPGEEIAGILLDKPLRAVTKKLLGAEHGLLPSAFYEGLTEEAGSGMGMLEKVMHAMLDELGSVMPSDNEIAAATQKLKLKAA